MKLYSKKKCLALICTIVIALMVPISVSAETVYVPAIAQEQSLWCWAACAQMVGGHYGSTLTQSDIVRFVKGSVYNVSANNSQIAQAAKYTTSRTHYVTSVSSYSFSRLQNDINNGRPSIGGVGDSSTSHVDECVVTVIVPATGIILDKSALTLPKGTQGDLTATITPEDATDKVVAWTSSDESIATVDSFSGKVTGVKVGKAVITATTHDGSFPASCNVTVVIPTTGITISQRTLNLIKGNNTALTATVLPEEATDQAVIWSTSDPDVVTVDSSGQVTATGGGLATITVKSHGKHHRCRY